MHFMIKILKWGAIVFLVVVLAIPALLLAINAIDEDLKPEVAAFAQPFKPRFSDKENAYYAIMGFQAAEGQHPHVVGRRIVAEYESQLAKDPLMTEFKTELYLGGPKLVEKGKVRELCDVQKGPCSLANYVAKEAEIERMLMDNRVLLERYRLLYTYPHFEEAATPTVVEPLPSYPQWMALLSNGEIAIKVKRGDTAQALDMLERDILFWRRVLSEARSSFAKAVVSNMLYRDYYLLSEIANSHPDVAKTYYDQLAKIALPLDKDVSNFAECVRLEFINSKHEWKRLYLGMRENPFVSGNGTLEKLLGIPTIPNWLWPLLKPNATINHIYEAFRSQVELAAMPAPRFAKEKEQIKQRIASKFDADAEFGWHAFYNPIGKYLTSVNQPDFSAHIARVHDLDGLIRLVALQVQIKSKGLSGAEIADYLNTADKRYVDPYTDRPMQWDPKQRLLFFNGMSTRFGKDGVVGVRVD